MAALNEKIMLAAEQILKRPLSEEEQLEIYRISDAMGAKDIQTYLYLLLVFKLHENTMEKQFEELKIFENCLSEKLAETGTLASRIDEKLKTSIEKILGDGAEQIGADMCASIAKGAKEALGIRDDYQFLRGQLCLVCLMGILTATSYWLGTVNALGVGSSPFGALFTLPAGWWMFFSWSLCTFMWAYDHWKLVKKSTFHKFLFAAQCVITLILLASLL